MSKSDTRVVAMADMHIDKHHRGDCLRESRIMQTNDIDILGDACEYSWPE